jgi:hypothetical protein
MKHSTRNLPARDPARFHTGVMPAPHTFHVTLTEWAHTKALPLRSDAYRDRRRHGRILVPVEVRPRQLAALERLAPLGAGETSRVLPGRYRALWMPRRWWAFG